MNRSTTVAIADAMGAVRPDWKQGGCISQIQVLAHTWQGTDAELAAHALAIAAMPTAHTPAAINAMPATPTRTPTGAGQGKEPACYICAHTRSRCRTLHDLGVRHGLPDPHIFESHEEADANTSRFRRFDPQQLALAAAPTINDAEDSPERQAAKARARAAVDQARQKAKWKPAPPPSEQRIQEPQPEPQEQPA